MIGLSRTLCASLCLAVLGCGSPEPAPSHDADGIRRSWTGLHALDGEPSCELLGDADAWSRAWQRAGKPANELPAVDFTRDRVLAVFHGDERAQVAMDAELSRDGDAWLLAYSLFSTSGELPPEVRPWGFYELSANLTPLRVESHHVTGPSQPHVERIASYGVGSEATTSE